MLGSLPAPITDGPQAYTFLTFVPVLAITTAIWAALLTAIWLVLRLALTSQICYEAL
jgi:hypothetical protein